MIAGVPNRLFLRQFHMRIWYVFPHGEHGKINRCVTAACRASFLAFEQPEALARFFFLSRKLPPGGIQEVAIIGCGIRFLMEPVVSRCPQEIGRRYFRKVF